MKIKNNLGNLLAKSGAVRNRTIGVNLADLHPGRCGFLTASGLYELRTSGELLCGALCKRDISGLKTPPTRTYWDRTERLETAPTV